MLNKIYGWIETNFAVLRNGEPAVDHSHGRSTPRDAQVKRKRPIEFLEDDHMIVQDDLAIKKSRMGDLIGSVKSAAEGLKNHSTGVATWMTKNVSPTLRKIPPASSGEPQASTSAASAWTGRPTVVNRNSLDETFAAPSTTLEWKTNKSEWLRNEKFVMRSKDCRQQVVMNPAHREVPKTNGHSINVPLSIIPKLQPSPRLGRPFNLRSHGTTSLLGGVGTSNSTSMYEKTFASKMVQSPTHSALSNRSQKNRRYCTAQESVCEEEKEIYRQLLAMVSGGQSSFLDNGSSHNVVRSNRDFGSFLTSHRPLQVSSAAGSVAGRTSEEPSSTPSPREISSPCSSNHPSPVRAYSKTENQMWSQDADLSSNREAALTSTLSPSTLQDKEQEALEEKPEFPELTEEMEAEVDKALMKGGSPHEILSEGFGLSLTRKDLQTLSSLNWLNDEVINFYMNLLVERSKEPDLPSTNTFNTFFYPKLRSSGYSAVRRWTKKMDIFSKDILLVPVHLGVHWCLCVVDFRKKSIMYFDSMGGSNDEACQILFDYLQQESKDKKGKEMDTSGWTLHSKKRSEIPQQMNGSDCGMFTCKYADYITKDKPITFTQKHMPYFRRRMVWEIVNHNLL
uniref:SUMO1/sentrin specific peptidase 1 n=1 Tax=Nothobranchius rachovii TaxID=451742 RepID=A0A1A8PMF7_9TELE